MHRSVRANRGERWRSLPGDGFIPAAESMLTHGISIRRPRSEVWPWLVQMGAGRAGWYSYDQVDNGDRQSAERIVPELQQIRVGDISRGSLVSRMVLWSWRLKPSGSSFLAGLRRKGLRP
jgi:hypothetical protein